MKKNSLFISVSLLFMLLLGSSKTEACSRAVYLGNDGLVITGRTMDWKSDLRPNIYIMPRGIKRAGHDSGKFVEWTSRYGSVVTAAYDFCTSDGMNEKGVVVSMLYLDESVYSLPGDTRPKMGVSIWPQYVLDNFATVREAVDELRKDLFMVDSPDLPGGVKTGIHLAITDQTGNSAIVEYIDGKLNIYEGDEHTVLTNSPAYDRQRAIYDYWKSKNGLEALPGTNGSSDRFVRAAFYIDAIPRTTDPKLAIPAVLSVMRNVSVPFGISTPGKPNISTTRWRSVSDQKNMVYYFESTLTPNLFFVDFKKIDFSAKATPKKLTLTDGTIYSGEVNDKFKSGTFNFMFYTPEKL